MPLCPENWSDRKLAGPLAETLLQAVWCSYLLIPSSLSRRADGRGHDASGMHNFSRKVVLVPEISTYLVLQRHDWELTVQYFS